MCSCIVGAAFGLLLLSGSPAAAPPIRSSLCLLPAVHPCRTLQSIKHPWYLVLFSYFAPLRYAADLTRNLYYRFTLNHDASVELWSPWANIAMMIAITVACLLLGTTSSCATNETDRRSGPWIQSDVADSLEQPHQAVGERGVEVDLDGQGDGNQHQRPACTDTVPKQHR